jgi:transposase
MDTNPLFTAALGLVPPWRVVRTDFHADQRLLEMQVDFTAGARYPCPDCSSAGCTVHDTVEKRWRHMDFFQHKAFILARVPRVQCLKCGVRQVAVPWARPGSGFTLLMEGLIMEMARSMPVRCLAQLLQVSDNRVWRVIKHYVDEAVSRIDCSRVTAIGVDETSAKKRHDYITCFFDMDARRLVFATEGREHQVVASFARFIGEHKGDASAVKEVSCDMSPAFIKGVREFLPKAEVTFDRFHVAKVLGDAVERVRRSEWRRDKTVKGVRFALLKNPINLTDRQHEQLRDITSRNAALAEVYRMKETFRDLYRQEDLHAATGFLKGWVATAMKSKLKPLIKAAKTIMNRAKGILRWYSTRMTNAVMEGLNSLLQAAKRKARGYRLHGTFITIAYLIAGKLDIRAASPFGSLQITH